MHCELSIFRMLFHGKLQSYSTAHKQNTKPESNRQEVRTIIECYKDFLLYDKFFFFSAYSRVQVPDPVETQTKRSEFSLIRGDKVLMLSYMSFHRIW